MVARRRDRSRSAAAVAATTLSTTAIMASLLVGCGSGPPAAGPPVPNPAAASSGTPPASDGLAGADPTNCPLGPLSAAPGPVDVTFWIPYAGVAGDEMSHLVDAYNHSQTQVKVTSLFQPDLMTPYLASLRGGDRPDLAAVNGSRLGEVVDSGAIVDAADCLAADHQSTSDFLPKALGGVRVNGKVVALPFDGSGLVVYYNKTAFKKAGLDPDVAPATLADLHADSLAIVKAGAAHHGVGWNVADGYAEEALYKSGASIVDHDDGRTGRATAATFDSAAAESFASQMQAMADDGSLVPFAGNDETSSFLATANGDTAMTIGQAGSMGEVLKAMSSGIGGQVDLGVGSAPAIDGTNAGGFAYIGAPLAISRGSDPAKVEAAYRFALWLEQPEQQAQWHVAVGSVPSRLSAQAVPVVTDLWQAKPSFRVGVDQVSDGQLPPGGGAFVTGPVTAVRDALDGSLLQVLTEHADPRTALSAAADQATDAIQSYDDRLDGGS